MIVGPVVRVKEVNLERRVIILNSQSDMRSMYDDVTRTSLYLSLRPSIFPFPNDLYFHF